MATSLKESEKETWIKKIQTHTYHLVKKIVKISPADPKLICLNGSLKKKIMQAKYMARLASLPSGLNKLD